jgi:hypothetical protein
LNRNVTAVILCEDIQSQVLLRRYLIARGFARIRPLPLPAACGEQYVRNRYAAEVKAQRRSNVSEVLVVHIDADKNSVANRYKQLEEKLADANESPRDEDEPIALVVPRYETETWLHHYQGRKNVTETESYPKFTDNQADAAKPTVSALIELVDGTATVPPNLPSLAATVDELRRLP